MSETSPSSRPLLGYQTLRRVTEWASGVRGDEPTWFVIRHGLTPDDAIIEPWETDPHAFLPPEELEQVVIIPSFVGHGVGNRDAIEFARIGPKPSGENSVNVIDPKGVYGDSVFWTQSAVEKFLVPYYASVGGADAANQVETVLKLLGNPREVEEGRATDGPVVYALVHLPQSEYTDIDRLNRVRAWAPGVPLNLAVGYSADEDAGVVHAVDFFDRFKEFLEGSTARETAGLAAGTA